MLGHISSPQGGDITMSYNIFASEQTEAVLFPKGRKCHAISCNEQYNLSSHLSS